MTRGLRLLSGSWTTTTGRYRGRVRTHVIDEHLRRHIGPSPQRVVDVEGGAGNQSIPLARAGHEVTIVDPSPAMLETCGGPPCEGR